MSNRKQTWTRYGMLYGMSSGLISREGTNMFLRIVDIYIYPGLAAIVIATRLQPLRVSLGLDQTNGVRKLPPVGDQTSNYIHVQHPQIGPFLVGLRESG